jgi:hypothetical protein
MNGQTTHTRGYRRAATFAAAAALSAAPGCNALSGADTIDFTGSTDPAGACPGASVSIDMGQALPAIADDTTGHTDKFKGASGNYAASCMNCDCQGTGTYSGPDLIYAITPSASGTLSLTLDATYPAWQLHVRTTCDNNTTADEIACVWGQNPGFSAGNPDAMSLSVTAGTTYFVAADSWDGSSAGSFTLTVSLN